MALPRYFVTKISNSKHSTKFQIEIGIEIEFCLPIRLGIFLRDDGKNSPITNHKSQISCLQSFQQPFMDIIEPAVGHHQDDVTRYSGFFKIIYDLSRRIEMMGIFFATNQVVHQFLR